jgi:hypothetical protein
MALLKVQAEVMGEQVNLFSSSCLMAWCGRSRMIFRFIDHQSTSSLRAVISHRSGKGWIEDAGRYGRFEKRFRDPQRCCV